MALLIRGGQVLVGTPAALTRADVLIEGDRIAAVGQFDPAQLEKTRDLYTQYLELKRKVGLEEIYTNDLLPAKK